MKLYGWKYKYKNGNLWVEYPSTIIRPCTFYKHYSLSKYNVDAVTNHQIYASHPRQLNDIMDVNQVLFEFDNPVLNRTITKDIPPYSSYSEEMLVSEECKLDIKTRFLKMFSSKWGIVSLTINPINWLMWSHYSKEDGFCVELDIMKMNFQKYGPFPINYRSYLRPIKLSEHQCYLPEALLAQTLIKHDRWSYENEWRLICDAGNDWMDDTDNSSWEYGIINRSRLFDYPIEAIKSVTLGYGFFFNESKESLSEDTFDIYFSHQKTECNVAECKHPSKDSLKMKLLDFLIKEKVPIGIIVPQFINEYVVYIVEVSGGNGHYIVHLTGKTMIWNNQWNLNKTTTTTTISF